MEDDDDYFSAISSKKTETSSSSSSLSPSLFSEPPTRPVTYNPSGGAFDDWASADWSDATSNSQRHPSINTNSNPTLFASSIANTNSSSSIRSNNNSPMKSMNNLLEPTQKDSKLNSITSPRIDSLEEICLDEKSAELELNSNNTNATINQVKKVETLMAAENSSKKTEDDDWGFFMSTKKKSKKVEEPAVDAGSAWESWDTPAPRTDDWDSFLSNSQASANAATSALDPAATYSQVDTQANASLFFDNYSLIPPPNATAISPSLNSKTRLSEESRSDSPAVAFYEAAGNSTVSSFPVPTDLPTLTEERGSLFDSEGSDSNIPMRFINKTMGITESTDSPTFSSSMIPRDQLLDSRETQSSHSSSNSKHSSGYPSPALPHRPALENLNLQANLKQSADAPPPLPPPLAKTAIKKIVAPKVDGPLSRNSSPSKQTQVPQPENKTKAKEETREKEKQVKLSDVKSQPIAIATQDLPPMGGLSPLGSSTSSDRAFLTESNLRDSASIFAGSNSNSDDFFGNFSPTAPAQQGDQQRLQASNSSVPSQPATTAPAIAEENSLNPQSLFGDSSDAAASLFGEPSSASMSSANIFGGSSANLFGSTTASNTSSAVSLFDSKPADPAAIFFETLSRNPSNASLPIHQVPTLERMNSLPVSQQPLGSYQQQYSAASLFGPSTIPVHHSIEPQDFLRANSMPVITTPAANQYAAPALSAQPTILSPFSTNNKASTNSIVHPSSPSPASAKLSAYSTPSPVQILRPQVELPSTFGQASPASLVKQPTPQFSQSSISLFPTLDPNQRNPAASRSAALPVQIFDPYVTKVSVSNPVHSSTSTQYSNPTQHNQPVSNQTLTQPTNLAPELSYIPKPASSSPSTTVNANYNARNDILRPAFPSPTPTIAPTTTPVAIPSILNPPSVSILNPLASRTSTPPATNNPANYRTPTNFTTPLVNPLLTSATTSANPSIIKNQFAASGTSAIPPMGVHPIVAFGFGGKIAVIYPSKTPPSAAFYNTVPKPVTLLSTYHVLESSKDEGYRYIKPLISFPGPLTPSTSKDSVLRHINERVNALMEDSYSQATESNKVLWEVLRIAVKHSGFMGPEDDKENAMKEIRELLSRSESTLNTDQVVNLNALSMHQMSPAMEAENLIKLQTLLIQGNPQEALKLAIDQRLWAHALLIAKNIDETTLSSTITNFATSSLAEGSPLRTFYLITANNLTEASRQSADPRQKKGPTLYDKWQENLSILLSNRKSDVAVFGRLGDALWSKHKAVEAAHLCYLVADIAFQEADNPNARLVLLGGDHKFNRSGYCNVESVQRTEILEYSRKIANANYNMGTAAPYKFIYACILADLGLVELASKYLQAIYPLVSGKAAANYPRFFIVAFNTFADRLSKHGTGVTGLSSGRWEVLSGLGSIVTKSLFAIIGEGDMGDGPNKLVPPVPSQHNNQHLYSQQQVHNPTNQQTNQYHQLQHPNIHNTSPSASHYDNNTNSGIFYGAPASTIIAPPTVSTAAQQPRTSAHYLQPKPTSTMPSPGPSTNSSTAASNKGHSIFSLGSSSNKEPEKKSVEPQPMLSKPAVAASAGASAPKTLTKPEQGQPPPEGGWGWFKWGKKAKNPVHLGKQMSDIEYDNDLKIYVKKGTKEPAFAKAVAPPPPPEDTLADNPQSSMDQSQHVEPAQPNPSSTLNSSINLSNQSSLPSMTQPSAALAPASIPSAHASRRPGQRRYIDTFTPNQVFTAPPTSTTQTPSSSMTTNNHTLPPNVQLFMPTIMTPSADASSSTYEASDFSAPILTSPLPDLPIQNNPEPEPESNNKNEDNSNKWIDE